MDVQADLSLCWVHMSEGAFSHIVVHIILTPTVIQVFADCFWKARLP